MSIIKYHQKVEINNSIKTFQVHPQKKYVEFNGAFLDQLTEPQFMFCMRWARKYLKHQNNILYTDMVVIRWFVNKYSEEEFNNFLAIIKDRHLYHRLVYGSVIKVTLWQRIRHFFSSGK